MLNVNVTVSGLKLKQMLNRYLEEPTSLGAKYPSYREFADDAENYQRHQIAKEYLSAVEGVSDEEAASIIVTKMLNEIKNFSMMEHGDLIFYAKKMSRIKFLSMLLRWAVEA